MNKKKTPIEWAMVLGLKITEQGGFQVPASVNEWGVHTKLAKAKCIEILENVQRLITSLGTG